MTFLTGAECTQWCRRRRFADWAQFDMRAELPGDYRLEFDVPADAGTRVALCKALWHGSDGDAESQERLLVVRQWGIWPSGEHGPLFTTLRSAFGESRRIDEAPGHLFRREDSEDGLSVLIVCALFLWDCVVYSVGSIVALSHDECGVVFEAEGLPATDLRPSLERLGVLK